MTDKNRNCIVAVMTVALTGCTVQKSEERTPRVVQPENLILVTDTYGLAGAGSLYKLCDNGRLVYISHSGGIAVVLDQSECKKQ